MTRSEFLRTSLFALVAAGIGLKGSKKVELEKFTGVKKVALFKITKEALQDQRYFAYMLDSYKVYGKIYSYEIEMIDDDFIRNFLTVKIEYAYSRI